MPVCRACDLMRLHENTAVCEEVYITIIGTLSRDGTWATGRESAPATTAGFEICHQHIDLTSSA